MPIDLSRLPESLTKAAETGNLVPFIGAGVSRQAETSLTKPFPNWTELVSDLRQLALVQENITPEEDKELEKLVKQGKFLMAAEAIKKALPQDLFDDHFRKRFADPHAKPGPIHERLFKLHPPLILTTNYDLLLEAAYWNVFREQAVCMTFKHADRVERFLKSRRHWSPRPLIFKIHGTATESDFVFTESDYRNLRYRAHGYRTVLSAIFVTKIVLMLGFSLADPEISVLTESLRESLDHRSSPDHIVLPKGEKGSIEKRRLREDFGLEVIEYEPTNNHEELLTLIDHLISFVPGDVRQAAGA